MKSLKPYVSLLFLMFIIFVPLLMNGVYASSSDNPQKIYTIQTGSFLTFTRAQKEFDFLMEALTKKDCHFLRVEKVGSFYTVRLGKFEGYSSAENLITSITPLMPKAMILKTKFEYDRLKSCICH